MPVANFAFGIAGGAAPVPGHGPALASSGLVMPVEVHVPAAIAAMLQQAQQPVPPPQTGLALVDTGASITCCNADALLALGLNPVGQITVGTANGPTPQFLYPATIRLPSTGGWQFELAAVCGSNLAGQMIPTTPPQQLLVLIGRDLLSLMTLHWNGPGGACTLSL
jgi:hypothetical protein